MNSYPNFRDLERIHGVTWHDLVDMEPKLAELLWQARQACATCRRWSDVDREFTPIRNTCAELIGFAGKNRSHRVLGSVGAYQVAYWKLHDAVAGLFPGRAAGAEEAMEKQRQEAVAENCLADAVAMASSNVSLPRPSLAS